MRAFPGNGYCKAFKAILSEPRDEVRWQKRHVCRDGRDGRKTAAGSFGPVYTRQNAGKRPLRRTIEIGHDIETKRSEPPGIAVGVEDERFDLRAECLYHMRQHRLTAEIGKPFVAAT